MEILEVIPLCRTEWVLVTQIWIQILAHFLQVV